MQVDLAGNGMAFVGAAVERHAELRDAPERLAELYRGGHVLVFWRGQVLLDAEGQVQVLRADAPILQGAGAPLYLGAAEGAQWFAQEISFTPEAQPEELFLQSALTPHPLAEGGFAELRAHLGLCEGALGAMLSAGRALLLWHRSHGFCAACGAASQSRKAGWERHCPACEAVHFPRTDPVAIMCVSTGEQVLLGRNAAWPAGMFSCLAGFVEAGETLEAAVAREVFEEAGVRVGAVRYSASQPWPFPASLMLGVQAEARTTEITIDPAELESARWVSRAELAQAFAGQHPEIAAPRAGTIARHLLAEWLALKG